MSGARVAISRRRGSASEPKCAAPSVDSAGGTDAGRDYSGGEGPPDATAMRRGAQATAAVT
jgi:hypothetical protein